MARWKRDVFLGVFFELVFAFAYRESFNISVGTMGDVKAAQPGVYVRLWLIVFAVLSLLMIIRAVIKRDKTVVPRMFHPQVLITLALLAVYIFSMKYIGFFLSTLIFVNLTIIDYTWAAGKFKNEDGTPKKGKALLKQILICVLIGVITTVCTQYIFGTLLKVNLPAWTL